MAVQPDDVWEMWALWHWRFGLVGNVYGKRRDLVAYALTNIFSDRKEYRDMCGGGKPYRIVKVDVVRTP